VALSRVIGFPGKPAEPKGPPSGFYKVYTKQIPDGRIHYGYLIITSTFLGITDDDFNLVYATPLDNLVEVTCISVDTDEGMVN
jgi:hypothetical protein